MGPIPTPDQFRQEAGIGQAGPAPMPGQGVMVPMGGQTPLLRRRGVWAGVLCAAVGAVVGGVLVRQWLRDHK